MSYLLWQSGSDLAIASSRPILRADEVPPLLEAQQLRDALEALHREQQERVDAACEAARASGHAQGLEEGHRAARDQLAATIASLSQTASEQSAQLRDEVAALALQVVRKLMGQIAQEAQLAGLAATAAREILPASAMTLVVHPDRRDAVREQLARLASAGSEDAPAVPAFELRDDASCAPDDCRIETDLGSVDASLDSQLARLSTAWGIRDTAVPSTARQGS